MKKTVTFAIIGLLLFSCGQKSSYDGIEVLVERYSDEELIFSDTLLVENNEIRFEDGKFDEGVYFVLSVDTFAPQALVEGFPFYINELGEGTIKITKDDVTLGGNPENTAYQMLRASLRRLNPEDDFAKQLAAWDEYFSEHLSHPLGEEVFLNDFDAYNTFVLAPEYVERFLLNYADESFLSRPAVLEMEIWMESLDKGALFR